MTMISIKGLLRYLLLVLPALTVMSSCGMMTEEEPDCNPYYKMRFLFKKNMLDSDAFSSQVGEVDLYAFSPDGELVWKGHEEGEMLEQEGYRMDIPLTPGIYDFVAWCHKRHENAAGFIMSGGNNPTSPDHLRMMAEREYDERTAFSSKDLHALFHGKLTSCELPDKWGTNVIDLPLTKNTNTLRIQLVHLSGKEINRNDFDFKIIDSNGHLNHDNTILEDEPLEYRAWSKTEGIANTVIPVVEDNPENSITPLDQLTRAVAPIHSISAEITTSRLQTSNTPMLIVTRKSDGERVVNIDLLYYLLMVKGEYHRNMDDDEYLDRQDEFNMTLFMHEDGSWYRNVIDILSWRIVRQTADL